MNKNKPESIDFEELPPIPVTVNIPHEIWDFIKSKEEFKECTSHDELVVNIGEMITFDIVESYKCVTDYDFEDDDLPW